MMTANKSIDGLPVRTPPSAPSSKRINSNRANSKRKITKPTSYATSSDPLLSSPRSISASTPVGTKAAKAASHPSPTVSTSIRKEFLASLDEDTPNPLLEDSSTKAPQATNPSTKTAKAAKTTEDSPTPEDFLSPVQTFDFDEQSGELTISKDTTMKSTQATKPTSKSKKSPSPKPPKKSKKKLRIILSVVIVIILLAATFSILWVNGIFANINGGNVFDLFTFMDEHYDPLKEDTNGRTNILAFGTSGYNMDGDEGDGTHDGAQLTDSIMVISLDQDTGDVAMLSLPRDLKASPTCTATGKINEVYWCNNMDGSNELAGATALMDEVSSILDMDIQYFAHLNWGSLVQIVDALDGITVTLDEDIADYYYTGAVFDAGVPYTINGEQALGLARARHGTTSGDFSRGASQQKILIGIKDKILEKGLSLTDLINFANILGDNFRTNLTTPELKTSAHLASTLDFSNMRQISLLEDPSGNYLMTTGTINGISYVFPSAGIGNYYAIQQYVAAQLSNDPLIYEMPTLIVLNATDTPGLASTENSTLVAAGFPSAGIDDAPIDDYPAGYTIYAISSDKPGTQSLLESHYSTTAITTDAEEFPYLLYQYYVPYYDFIIVVNTDTTK